MFTARQAWEIAYRTARVTHRGVKMCRTHYDREALCWVAAISCGFKTGEQAEASRAEASVLNALANFSNALKGQMVKQRRHLAGEHGAAKSSAYARARVLRIYAKYRESAGDPSLMFMLKHLAGTKAADQIAFWMELDNPRTAGQICAPASASPRLPGKPRAGRAFPTATTTA